MSFTVAVRVDANHVMRMAARTREDEQGKGWTNIIFNDRKYKEFTRTTRGQPVKFTSSTNYKPQIHDRLDLYEEVAMKWASYSFIYSVSYHDKIVLLLFTKLKPHETIHSHIFTIRKKACFTAFPVVQRR